MSMHLLAQVLTFAVLTSGLYALLALGFTLIFGVARVLDLAHGGFLMAGAYLFYIGLVLLHLPMALAFALSVILTGVAAIVGAYLLETTKRALADLSEKIAALNFLQAWTEFMLLALLIVLLLFARRGILASVRTIA